MHGPREYGMLTSNDDSRTDRGTLSDTSFEVGEIVAVANALSVVK